MDSEAFAAFASPSEHPRVKNEPPPPPPYPGPLPQEFVKAGVEEDHLQMLAEYDTIIIVDDSGSMRPLWGEVSDLSTFSPLQIESLPDFRRPLLKVSKALSELAAIASRYDKDGIDIKFLNHWDCDRVGLTV